MKLLLPAFISLVIFMGCKSNNNEPLNTNKNIVLVDTTGLSKGSILSDTAANRNQLKKGITSTISSTTTTTTTTTTNGGALSHNPGSNDHKISTGSTNNSSANSTPATASDPRDKGWSDAAKGTVIGAGSGAVIGAVVSKNKVEGAIIGGVLGGGAGYAIGRSRDRKSGRVARKKRKRRY